MGMTHPRHSRSILRTERWKAVRLQAKRRDEWKCVSCGSVDRLEVDHIIPVRRAPERAFDLTNLQTLCTACHSRKTRIEVGMGEPNPAREAWKDAVRDMMPAKHNTGVRNA